MPSEFTVKPNLTQRVFPRSIVRWDRKDVQTYRDSVQTDWRDVASPYQTAGERPPDFEAVPGSFGNILGRGQVPVTAFGDYPLSAVVHAQQSLSIPRPLDFCGELVVETRVLWVKATRRGAFVGVRSIAADQLTATEAVQLTRTIFVKDAHAQDEGTAPLNDSTVPENRPPDFEMTGKTSNSQAVLFAQNGDNNPIHLDPVMARARGFERPILHGLCTLGIADRLFSGRSSPAPAGTVMAMRCRFVAEAYPGSKLVAKAWRSRGRLDFQVYSDNLLVIDHGQMSFSIPGE